MNQVSNADLDRRHDTHSADALREPQRIASTELLRGQRRLIIEHGDATYVLLVTRSGKLILNK